MRRISRTVKVSKARKAAVERRVAGALAGFLKKINPAMKTAGAKVQRLKGGVIKITPIRANRAMAKLKRTKQCLWCNAAMPARSGGICKACARKFAAEKRRRA